VTAKSPSHLRCANRGSFENPRTTIQIVHTGSSIGRIAYLRGVAYFLCTLVHGPSWDDARGIREQDGWEDHAAFMDRLVEEGLIIVGGPVGKGEHTAHLIESEDPRRDPRSARRGPVGEGQPPDGRRARPVGAVARRT
jgi:hypothetical protein